MKYLISIVSLYLISNISYAAPSCSELRTDVKWAKEQLNDWKSSMRSSQRNNAISKSQFQQFGVNYDTSIIDSHSDSVLQEREERLADAQMEYDHYCN